MKVVILYRPNSEHGRSVESFIRDFKYQHRVSAKMLDMIDVDTREGVSTASLYDVMQYPAVLVLADNGSLLKSWEGGNLPLMNDISAYVYSG